MKTCLIPISAAEYLTAKIKDKINGLEVVFPDLSRDGKRYFPDGEVYMKIVKAAQLKNKRAVVLHSGAPKPNEGLVELELILQILRDSDVKPEVFFTYFPYGMQDKVFEKGETNVAENLIEKLVHYYKVRKIFVIDPHFGGRKWVKRYPLQNVSAVPLLSQKARTDFGNDIMILSPDKGGKRRTNIHGFQKIRYDSFHVEMFSSAKDMKGKTVAVVDDMIQTGGTLLKFYEIAKKMGAKKVIALVTHGVLPLGIARIQKTYDKLYLTNTIRQSSNISTIDIGNLILNTLS